MFGEEDVLRLDIAMDDVALVHVLHSLVDLPQQPACARLLIRAVGLEPRLQVAAHHELHDEIDTLLCRDEVDELSDVRVMDSLEDFGLGWLQGEVFVQLPG